MAQNDGGNQESDRYIPVALNGPLDEFSYPGRGANILQVAQNVVHRRGGAIGKRTGTGPYGTAPTMGAQPFAGPIRSGYRWYRGKQNNIAAPLRVMLVQSGDAIYVGNDVTGIFTLLVTLAAGSSDAYFASMYDPAIMSDIVIITYGSGAPLKWDGTNAPSQLSATITNHFLGVYFWHDHAWFWGDPAYPDDLYASDLEQPEGFTFMAQFGAYQIGRGDGDSLIKGVIDDANVLYVFKNATIYTVTGFDFVQGEYPFSIQPSIPGTGTSNGKSIARLPSGDIIYWSGSGFRRKPTGANQTIPVGTQIQNSTGAAAAGNQGVIRATAGSFLVAGAGGQVTYNDFYFCAMDVGSGVADHIFAYDDYSTATLGGTPRWAVWTGVTVGAFIPWIRNGDPRWLMIGDGANPRALLLGQNAVSDSGNPIMCSVKSTRDDGETPDKLKQLTRVYLAVEANATTFYVTAELDGVSYKPIPTSNQGVLGQQSLDDSLQTAQVFAGTPFGTSFPTYPIGTTPPAFHFGTSRPTQYQSIGGSLAGRYGKARNFTFSFDESSATSLWEILGMAYRVIEETYETS